MNEKRPILKLAENLPVTLVFETLPSEAKEQENKFNPEKPTHIYFVGVVASDGITEVPHVWFATDRQHQELLQKSITLGTQYTAVLKKLPGDKYAQFMIAETFGTNTAPVASQTPQAASHKRDPMVLGMCFKKAVDICMQRGDIGPQEVKFETNRLYAIYQELMSE